MDFPSFLRQAGAARVSVLLQPSNTWGPIGDYHFRTNALRAVENGFTHIRCSSGGYSGAATPFYSFVHRVATLRNATVSFTVPLRRGPVWTVYSHGGFVFEWAIAAMALAIAILTILPSGFARRCLPQRVARHLLLGDLSWSSIQQQHFQPAPSGEMGDSDDFELRREPLPSVPLLS
jgi:hypothetical protein